MIPGASTEQTWAIGNWNLWRVLHFLGIWAGKTQRLGSAGVVNLSTHMWPLHVPWASQHGDGLVGGSSPWE